MEKLEYINNELKHVKIEAHPLKKDKYLVLNVTFPYIPPFIGTLKQCKKAALSAEKNSEKLCMS